MKTTEDNIVRVAKALSDKTRLLMLKEIAKKGKITCGDIEEISCLSQPTISHHLKVLFDADLLNMEKDGRCVIVSINLKALKKFGLQVSDTIK